MATGAEAGSCNPLSGVAALTLARSLTGVNEPNHPEKFNLR